ncbi:MAG: phospho-N-acetylmuramoyl-pentapeptide-transferase [Lachnospiraceae bacterium]|jgi:phospho-N-acetylmuramoyl-pentapeptide-transferase|nr:phospho-N-acetylmuramoyl-pentapeptide-transferase [Lachnospiraceae bacterium]
MYKNVVFALIISFVISVIGTKLLIPILTNMKMRQTERTDGVASHLKKAGTPTMGGIAIIVGFFFGSIIFASLYRDIIPVVLLTVGFGVIGFLDDYLKVVKRNPDGLKPMQKMCLQIILTGVFAGYLWFYADENLLLRIPFTNGKLVNIGIFSLILVFICVIGTVNGTNFTDGLDGLATTVTIPVAIYFFITSLFEGEGIEVVAISMVGALLGFLIFNKYPAKIFMGDTGSLALGGFVAGSAYMLQRPLYIIIIGAIYLIEVISVILQVGYFKATGGKRIFRMAPIHHHFELGGWSEVKIVVVFSLITCVLCVVAFFI